jgi:hypothetical protein
MDWGLVLGLIALICVCLPCRWDPAIILSERLREHAKRNEKEKLDGWPKNKDRDADQTRR